MRFGIAAFLLLVSAGCISGRLENHPDCSQLDVAVSVELTGVSREEFDLTKDWLYRVSKASIGSSGMFRKVVGDMQKETPAATAHFQFAVSKGGSDVHCAVCTVMVCEYPSRVLLAKASAEWRDMDRNNAMRGAVEAAVKKVVGKIRP